MTHCQRGLLLSAAKHFLHSNAEYSNSNRISFCAKHLYVSTLEIVTYPQDIRQLVESIRQTFVCLSGSLFFQITIDDLAMMAYNLNRPSSRASPLLQRNCDVIMMFRAVGSLAYISDWKTLAHVILAPLSAIICKRPATGKRQPFQC